MTSPARSSCSSRARSMRTWLSCRNSPELRARKIGHVIFDMAMDRPWSQYFCCHPHRKRGLCPAVSDRDQAVSLRAILKATDLCADRAGECRAATGRGRLRAALRLCAPDDHRDALQSSGASSTRRIPCVSTRSRLHEFGMIDSTPQSDHRRRDRLAFPERAQARAEGVSHARRFRSSRSGCWRGRRWRSRMRPSKQHEERLPTIGRRPTSP